MAETKIFRLLVLLSAVLVVVVGGFTGYTYVRESSLRATSRLVYDSYDTAMKRCEADPKDMGCEFAKLQRESLRELGAAQSANYESRDTAFMALLAVPAAYILFLLVRFAFTSRVRPFWPWRLL